MTDILRFSLPHLLECRKIRKSNGIEQQEEIKKRNSANPLYLRRLYDIIEKGYDIETNSCKNIFTNTISPFYGTLLMLKYEWGQRMEQFFTADYRDGRVRIGDKTYAAGAYVVHLLNQYYKNDTALRLSVYKQHGWNVAEQLSIGYLKEQDFFGAREEIQHILVALPDLKPFDKLDIDAERNRMYELFSRDNFNRITDYFRSRSAVGNAVQDELELDILPHEYDKEIFQNATKLITDISDTLAFYNAISDDMQRAHKQLIQFVSRVDEAERLDEAHLLPIAIDVFGSVSFPVKTEYVPQRKNAKSISAVVARRQHFESYYSFILTDFFEGLHFGHYPRRCEVCKRYFLMTSARRQRYCNGLAPYEHKGKQLTCRKYAASINRKELAVADPVVDLYNRRCAAIRTEKSRGTITEEFAEAAKALAKEYKYRAQYDTAYANKQYKLDLQREHLYAETDKRLR